MERTTTYLQQPGTSWAWSRMVKDVVVIARETRFGVFEYRLSKGTSLGARFLMEPTGGADRFTPSGVEGDTEVEINISVEEPSGKRQKLPQGWGEVEADAPITNKAIAAITADLNAELAQSGLVFTVTTIGWQSSKAASTKAVRLIVSFARPFQ